MDNKKSVEKLFSKLPYGIICGACAMFVFFATAGLIVSYIVFAGIASQTADKVAFLEYGWQIALFVFDVIFALVAIASLTLYILKKRKIVFAEESLGGKENESV